MNVSRIILPLGLVTFMGLAFAGTSSNDGAKIMFDELDADDNGKVTQEEAKANETVARHFDKLDADGNGTLSRDELRKAKSSSSSS